MDGWYDSLHCIFTYISLSIEGSNQGSMFLGLPEVCYSIASSNMAISLQIMDFGLLQQTQNDSEFVKFCTSALEM